jgi:hypothetical protein
MVVVMTIVVVVVAGCGFWIRICSDGPVERWAMVVVMKVVVVVVVVDDDDDDSDNDVAAIHCNDGDDCDDADADDADGVDYAVDVAKMMMIPMPLR